MSGKSDERFLHTSKAMKEAMAESRRSTVAAQVFAVLLAQNKPVGWTAEAVGSEVEALARRAYAAADIFIRAGQPEGE